MMKPTFALDLSRDVIALLHRTTKGWLSVGEVGFDAPDLDDAMDYLRKTAFGLSPMGMATKIVLPASQILYTEVHAPGPSLADKMRQIAAALEGRTPYDVADLVFDWSGTGPTVQVAVVARETLDEAEAFAVGHRMNPVSYVAVPEPGSFAGEVWFGPTAAAAGILAANETVERDSEPVVIVQRDFSQPEPPFVAPSPGDLPSDELPGLDAVLNADLPMSDGEAASSPGLASAGAALVAGPDAAADPFTPELEDEVDSLPGGAAPATADPAPLAGKAPSAEADAPVEEAPFAEVVAEDAEAFEAALEEAARQAALSDALLLKELSVKAAKGGAITKAPVAVDATPDQGMVALQDPDADSEGKVATAMPLEEAPFAEVPDPAGAVDADAAKPPVTGNRPALADDLIDDLPPAPPAAAMLAFASRRAAGATATPAGLASGPALMAKRGADAAPGLVPGRAVPPAVKPAVTPTAARISPAKGVAGLVTAARIPGTRTKPKGKLPLAEGIPAGRQGPQGTRSLIAPDGTFGAAKPKRNRTALVFMVLVGVLLVSLALVAAWSSYLLVRDTSDSTTETAVEALPGVEDEMLADMQDPEGLTGPLPEAEAVQADGQADAGAMATETLDPTSIESDPAPINLAEEEATDLPAGTLAEPLTEDLADPAADPAPETAVATDISAATAPIEDQDEIFLSAMDAPPPALDALALPAPAAPVDKAPEAPMPPPAFGTVYQFDANGLLLPTTEGILSPDGIMLIAGQPPLVPPLRSDIVTAAAAAAEAAAPPVAAPADASLVTGDATADAAATTALPEETAVTPEAAAAEALPVDPALTGVRPRPRPESLLPTSDDDAQLATEEDTTKLAGLRPLPRPASVLAAASASRPADADAPGLATAELGAQGASLTAQAEAEMAAAMALEASDPSIVAISMRPLPRPREFSAAVEAAVAAAARDPDPEAEIVEVAAAPEGDLKPEEIDELEEPEVAEAAPSIPTKASVAKQATFANAINLSKLNLIGTYGTSSNRYALIRQSNGRYKKVEVGDKIDGGRIEAITETEVRYEKNGKLVALKMPKA